MSHLPWLILTTVYGAIAGSFINVVACRMPANMSLIKPGSMCPKCQHKLAWYDNIPILGWFMVRGKCRYCKAPISVQYPIVEAITALSFGGMYWALYCTELRPDFSRLMSGQVPIDVVKETWPALIVYLVLLGALIAATIIDFRHYIIPLPITWTIVVIAILVFVGSAAMQMRRVATIAPHLAMAHGSTREAYERFVADSMPLLNLAIGGTIGLIIANILLKLGVIPHSFADESTDTEDGSDGGDASHGDHAKNRTDSPHGTPEEWMAHPHPRREVLKELLFVVWPVAGAALAYYLMPAWTVIHWRSGPAISTLVAGGVVFGYLVGGAIVWLVRILGTLVFGKEAMGLGDVHLLAAIGAVIGWFDSVLVFFIAPFMGLVGAAVAYSVGKLSKGKVRVIPYGPYLAAAAVVLIIFRVPIRDWFVMLFLPS